MTTLAALAPVRPRGFVPPGDRGRHFAHRDPRPLWAEPAAVASPWRSPTFWLAGALVLPVAGAVRLARLFGNGTMRR